jgi:hypothetical protein
MVDFFWWGGYNMWVLVAIGVPMLITGVKFARNADPQRLSLIRALTWALGFSIVAGVAAGLMGTARSVVRDGEQLKEPLRFLLQGFAETMTNAILGGSIASVTWILVAVGVRRMPPDHS